MHTVGYEIATYILYADKLSSCPTEGHPYFICKALYSCMVLPGSLTSLYIYLYGQTVYIADGISQYTDNAAYASSSVYAGKEYNPAICLTTDYSYTHTDTCI